MKPSPSSGSDAWATIISCGESCGSEGMVATSNSAIANAAAAAASRCGRLPTPTEVPSPNRYVSARSFMTLASFHDLGLPTESVAERNDSLQPVRVSTIARWLPWVARLAWVFVAVVGGRAIEAAVDGRSSAVRWVAGVGGWAAWGRGPRRAADRLGAFAHHRAGRCARRARRSRSPWSWPGCRRPISCRSSCRRPSRCWSCSPPSSDGRSCRRRPTATRSDSCSAHPRRWASRRW